MTESILRCWGKKWKKDNYMDRKSRRRDDFQNGRTAKEYLLFYFLKGTNILVHVKEYTGRTREELMTSSLDYNHNEIKNDKINIVSCGFPLLFHFHFMFFDTCQFLDYIQKRGLPRVLLTCFIIIYYRLCLTMLVRAVW